MSESSRTSGVLVRPRWKREPSELERILAFAMTLIPVIGLVLCTFDARNQTPKVKAAAEQLQNSAKSLGLLSAADGGSRLAASSDGSLASRYSVGRRTMAESFASLGRDLKADRDLGDALPWVGVAILSALGIVFCFFGWPLRRYASALYGAAWLGYIAFALAMKKGGMQPLPAGLVALAPAFLGVLIGWHLVVAMSCVQVATLICAPAAWAFVSSRGAEGLPAWFIPVAVSAWALMVALAYLFLVRAALISTMAVGGGLAVAMAASTLLVACKDMVMPWEAVLAIIAFFAILGNVTQYRFAGARAGSGDEGGPGDAGKPRPKPKPA
jgi:hypothetical protein